MVVNGVKANADQWHEMVGLYREFLLHNEEPDNTFTLRLGNRKEAINLLSGRMVIEFIGDVVAGNTSDPRCERFIDLYQAIIGSGTNRSVTFEYPNGGISHRELFLETGEEFDQFFTEVSKMVA